MWPYPWTHVGTPSHLGHMDRVAATMPSQAHAGAAQEAPDIGQWEGQDVPLVRPSSCNVKGGIPSSRRYLPTYLPDRLQRPRHHLQRPWTPVQWRLVQGYVCPHGDMAGEERRLSQPVQWLSRSGWKAAVREDAQDSHHQRAPQHVGGDVESS